MSEKKPKSGSRRKCDTAKHRKKQRHHRKERREIRDQQAAAKEIDRVHDEAEFAQRNFGKRDAQEVCPLCNQPITAEDLKGNIHEVTFDHKKVKVHRTCPGETDRKENHGV